MKFFDLPPVWTIAAIAVIFAIEKLGLGLGLTLPLRFGGSILVVIGIALAIWTAITLRRARTPIHPGHTPTALVQSGPFSFSRNPIYTGMVMVTCGIAFYYGNLIGLIPAAALFFVLDRKFARPEEAGLIQAFGDDAREYVERVRRW